MNLLEVRCLSASYGRIKAISDVSFSVAEGKFVVLLGSNGAGKSTTLKVLSGLLANQEGSIWFEGQRIDRLGSDRRVAMGIVQVPEGREVFGDMSVLENLQMGAHQRRDRAGIRTDIERMYDYFPVLEKRARQKSSTLSGGEQQMLLIARALMSRPRILLLDEPSLGLSPLLVQQIFSIIVRLHKEGLTLFVVEQNARLALAHSDYGYVLENGENVADAPSTELLASDLVRNSYLGA